jgi:hypothetical protein
VQVVKKLMVVTQNAFNDRQILDKTPGPPAKWFGPVTAVIVGAHKATSFQELFSSITLPIQNSEMLKSCSENNSESDRYPICGTLPKKHGCFWPDEDPKGFQNLLGLEKLVRRNPLPLGVDTGFNRIKPWGLIFYHWLA